MSTNKNRERAAQYGPSIFGDVSPKFDEVFKPLISLNYANGFGNPYQYETTLPYFVSNYGNVVSVKAERQLSPIRPSDTNNKSPLYYVVKLMMGKGQKIFYVHRLVAYLFCDNRQNKNIVHHIDGDTLNNNYKNLIYVNIAEHKECHRLMDAKQKKDYRAYIRKIRNENKWHKGEKYRWIINPDGEPEKGWCECYYIAEKAYQQLIDGDTMEQIDPDDIKGQYLLITERG